MTSISSSSNLEIKNDKWTVGQLLINKKNIIKPKFQRKKWWTIHPVINGKPKPNYKDYIDFLRKTKNTIDPISFGEEIKNINEKPETIYINVDGNNRINAIITFMQTPLIIYPEYLTPLNELLDTFIDKKIITILDKETFIKFLNTLDYETFSRLKQFKSLYEKNHEIKGILNKITNIDERDLIEGAIFTIQKVLLIDNKHDFDQTVIINVNIFKKASFEELCMIFQNINKHNHCLSETELLASILIEQYITIENKSVLIVHGIKQAIKGYYSTKENNEILDSCEFDESKINSFDIMVGLQNYCSSISEGIIPLFDPSDVSLYFKIYRQLHNSENTLEGLHPSKFSNQNVNVFINEIIKAVEIINSSMNKIFNNKINEKLFTKKSKSKTAFLGKNNLFIIIISIIHDLKNNKLEQDIIDYSTRCILYHILLKDFKDYEDEEQDKKKVLFEKYDIFHYEAGGGYIESQANKIMKGELVASKKITEKIFTEVVEIIIKQNNQPVTYQNKKPKRRTLKFIDHCLTSFYYNKYVSNIYLDNKYSIEHIVPFSSCWEQIEEIDIDRIGNLIPIIDSLNKGRGNGHIEYYEKTNSSYVSLLKNIPNKEKYDKIVNHDTRTPNIINVENYNKLCEENEKKYLENFINQCFHNKK
jgi:hypothetical protein